MNNKLVNMVKGNNIIIVHIHIWPMFSEPDMSMLKKECYLYLEMSHIVF